MLSGTRVNLNEVVEKAKKGFVKGYQNNKNLKAEAEKNPEIGNKYDLDHRYLSIKDEPFIGDRTRIPGTNFIASAGPKNESELQNLIQDTVFHSSIPTSQIVAFGSVTAYNYYDYQDFFDYCLKERNFQCGPYDVNIKRLHGEISTTMSEHQTFPKGIVDSEVRIKHEHENKQSQLNVSVFGIIDNGSIDFRSVHDIGFNISDADLVSNYLSIPREEFDAYDKIERARLYRKSINKLIEETKEKYWQLFQKSLHEQILVHRASGVGRTGHFILTMEILKHYDDIFSGNNADASVAKIHALLQNMRNVRVGLVFTENQFANAIYNAKVIHEYALKKRYIKTVEQGNDVELTKQPTKSIACNDIRVTPISLFQQPLKIIDEKELTQQLQRA